MKRISVIAFAVICLLVAVGTIPPVSAAESYVRGDADGDGEVTIMDATAIQRKLVDIPIPSFNEKAADVDGDGLNITDATSIQRYLADFENIHHINETVAVPDPTAPLPTGDQYELPFIPSK